MTVLFFLTEPPSFEEATTISGKFIDRDVDERNRTDEFIPKYPMYTNFAVPTAPIIDYVSRIPLLQSQGTVPPPYRTSANQQSTRETSGYGWNS